MLVCVGERWLPFPSPHHLEMLLNDGQLSVKHPPQNLGPCLVVAAPQDWAQPCRETYTQSSGVRDRSAGEWREQAWEL